MDPLCPTAGLRQGPPRGRNLNGVFGKGQSVSAFPQPPLCCPSPPPVCQLLSPARAFFSTSLFLGDEMATQPLPARDSDLVCPLSVSWNSS